MQANSPWRIIGVVVVLVLFVLGVFQPFGIGGLKGIDKLISLGLSGLGSFSGVVIMVILFPRLFPRYYAPARLTVGKHVVNQLAILLMIGLCTWAFQLGWFVVREGYMPAYWFEMLGKLVIAVCMVSPIPLAMTEVMLRNQHLQTYMQEVEEMNRRLTASREAADTSPLLADSAETSPASVPENDPSSVFLTKNIYVFLGILSKCFWKSMYMFFSTKWSKNQKDVPAFQKKTMLSPASPAFISSFPAVQPAL